MKFWAVVALAIVISDGIEIVGDLSMCGESAAVTGDDNGRLFIRNDKHGGLE